MKNIYGISILLRYRFLDLLVLGVFLGIDLLLLLIGGYFAWGTAGDNSTVVVACWMALCCKHHITVLMALGWRCWRYAIPPKPVALVLLAVGHLLAAIVSTISSILTIRRWALFDMHICYLVSRSYYF